MSLFGAVADSYVAASTPGTGYATAVLADSPWLFLQQQETTGTTLSDSSGNGRDLTASGSGFALAQVGPSSFMPAVSYPTGTGNYYSSTGAVLFNSSTGTVEVWFYITANPPAILPLIQAQNNGVGSITKHLFVNTNGSISFGITGSTFATSAAGAVPLNQWNHAIGSVGAAGTKVRLNKSTVATLGNTSSSSSALAPGVHKKHASSATNSGVVLIAAPAIWSSQIADANTDAHYDAMFA